MAFPKQGPVVAIDGPAGTGKSSTTKRLAEVLGFVHVDTGALYRAIGLMVLEQNGLTPDELLNRASTEVHLSPQQQEQISRLAREMHLEFKRDKRRNPSNRIFANGKDVTDRIRTPEVSMAASLVSSIPEVRAALLGLQRRLGCVGKTILEGRDIGTVIFPDADVKFFFVASIEERAKRRLMELEAAGADTPSFEELKHQMEIRDKGDSSRKTAPLKKADDAIEIDTTQFTLDEVVKKVEQIVRSKLSR